MCTQRAKACPRREVADLTSHHLIARKRTDIRIYVYYIELLQNLKWRMLIGSALLDHTHCSVIIGCTLHMYTEPARCSSTYVHGSNNECTCLYICISVCGDV